MERRRDNGEGEGSCTTQCRVYKLLGRCHKQSRENPYLSNVDMQEAPDLLLPIEIPGSFLHLSDDGHLTVELQQVRPRYLHLPGGSILQAV